MVVFKPYEAASLFIERLNMIGSYL